MSDLSCHGLHCISSPKFEVSALDVLGADLHKGERTLVCAPCLVEALDLMCPSRGKGTVVVTRLDRPTVERVDFGIPGGGANPN